MADDTIDTAALAMYLLESWQRESSQKLSNQFLAEETYKFSAEELCRSRAPNRLTSDRLMTISEPDRNLFAPLKLDRVILEQQLKNNNLMEDEDMARALAYNIIGGLAPDTSLEDFKIYGFPNRLVYSSNVAISDRNWVGLNTIIKKAKEQGMTAEDIAKRFYDGLHNLQNPNVFHYFGNYGEKSFSGFFRNEFTLNDYIAAGNADVHMNELTDITPNEVRQLTLINLEKLSLDFWFQSKRKRMNGASSVKEYTDIIKDTDVRFVLLKRIFIQDMLDYGQIIGTNEIKHLRENYGTR